MSRAHGRRWLLASTVLLGLLFLVGQAHSQDEGPAAELAGLVNAARIDAGLAPYDLSQALNSAAQRHADDLAAHNLNSSTGSDGSTPSQRIAEANYVAWPGATGERFWIGSGDVESAFDWFVADTGSQEDLLDERFREIGIGLATSDGGQLYVVLDFGARPNVLPVFINDDEPTTESQQVTLHLTNEETQPEGEGTLSMGRAIEVRISDVPSFEGLSWRPWEPLVDWTLPAEAGQHIVYVQFRDAAGRTAASTDDIVLLGEEGAPTPTPTLPATPTPTAVPSPGETASPTAPLPTATLSPALPPISATPPPSAAHPFPTWTPLPPAPAQETSGPGALVGALCGLQFLAALLGLYVALRRTAQAAPAMD